MNYHYKLISTERAALMGFAILWVMFFHSAADLSNIPVIGIIKRFGNLGVDIFLLLSGLGLFYSANKISYENNNIAACIKNFYIKRLLRIVPATIVCMFPWYLYLYRNESVNPIRFIADISSISYWIDGSIKGDI